MFNIYRAERVLQDEQSQTLEAQKEQKRLVNQISTSLIHIKMIKL